MYEGQVIVFKRTRVNARASTSRTRKRCLIEIDLKPGRSTAVVDVDKVDGQKVRNVEDKGGVETTAAPGNANAGGMM